MTNRRTFLKTAGIAAASFGFAISAQSVDRKRKLAFSTIGCPDWDLAQAAAYASANGYDGIEVRGIQRELDLTKANGFQHAAARQATRSLMADHALEFVGFGASTRLHIMDKVDRQKQLDEAKRFIDLAAELDCPFVRVFPDKLPEEQAKEQTLDLIISGLLELGAYASETPVIVLLETHGDVVYTEDILHIMREAAHPHIALLWDVFNMWSVTGETPSSVYRQLTPYIRHVHLKDGKRGDKGPIYTMMGTGEAPITDTLRQLDAGAYRGYLTLEWEKLWHPELPEPEVAFADFIGFMKRFK